MERSTIGLVIVAMARSGVRCWLVLWLLLSLASVDPLAARQSPEWGTMAGRVLSAQVGGYLEGVQVRVPELGRQTRTDREGIFTFGRVPAGTYTLHVSYMGLDSRELEVVVRPDAREFVAIELSSAIFRLEEMVITGQIEGQGAAINLQRTSDNLKTVVSQDALGQVQEGNIGDALNRLPGITVETRAGVQRTATIRGLAPQYNSVTVDGFTMTNVDGDRDIALDSYPSNTLARVEVVRAVTPDMPGDAIGGTVNLVTRTAFDRAGRTSFGNVGSTYNAKRRTLNRQVEATVGDVFGADGNLGALFTVAHFRDVRGYDVSNIGYSVDEDGHYTVTNNLVYDRDETKNKYGLGLNLDYRAGEDARLFFKAMYHHDYRWLHRRGTDYRPAANQVNNLVFYREPKNVFQMYIAGGSHQLGDWGLDYRTAYSKADKSYPVTFQVTQGFDGVELAVDRSDPGFPSFAVTNGVDLADPSAVVLRNMQVTQAPRGEDEIALEANVRRAVQLGPLPASLQGGVRYAAKDASQDQPDYAQYRVSGADVTALLESYQNSRFFTESNGRATLSPFFPDRGAWLDAFRNDGATFTNGGTGSDANRGGRAQAQRGHGPEGVQGRGGRRRHLRPLGPADDRRGRAAHQGRRHDHAPDGSRHQGHLGGDVHPGQPAGGVARPDAAPRPPAVPLRRLVG
jgi:hypothetical protein